MKKYILFISIGILLLTGCATSRSAKKDNGSDKALEELSRVMAGKFSSEAQSKADTSLISAL